MESLAELWLFRGIVVLAGLYGLALACETILEIGYGVATLIGNHQHRSK